MAGNYWIKLYIEILGDSKMAILPDRLWRRVVELFLLAGRYHQDGALPDTAELAWALRLPMDDLDLDMKQIASTGIIERTAYGWNIPKFKIRQEPPPAERMRQSRDKKRKELYYADVTNCNNPVTQITDNRLTDNRLTETELKEKEEKAAKIYQFYEANFGVITKYLADEIGDAIDTYPFEWIMDAMQRAVIRKALNWAYVLTILKDWKANGFQNKDERKNGKPQSIDEGYTNVTQQRLAKQNTVK